ncbi:hypothetical protein ABZW03_34140 [Kitasatospora sp. NPDC004799]|uniref:hypothetical protein n=1 Tax=Kitasatospora sp. NPDC004799 TaxID=3154460 RepID=UPI0033A85622
MEIPEHVRRAVELAVHRGLRSELDARGLLLTPEALASATAEAARSGAALLQRVVEHCYPDGPAGARRVEYDDDRAARRIGLGLAFGAVTAGLLAPPRADRGRAAATGLACAVLNLGVGLIDSLCDGAQPLGLELLRRIRSLDLAGIGRSPWPAGRLRSALPAPLVADPTVAFAARLVEAFVDLLHTSHPAEEDAPLRDRVGALLEQASAAERLSVELPDGSATRDRLIACSRSTSVLPFQIIEHLATGLPALPAPTAGTLLGEAMWRIDDLVDLAQDAAGGALNSVLLATADAPRSAPTRDGTAALERVLASGVIAPTAAEAAKYLEAGLTAASGGSGTRADRSAFLAFIHRYAGISSGDR